MYITGPERRKCPAHIQDRITRMFGKNRFGEPNFKIVWGQSQFIKQGNVWRDKFGNERGGYRMRSQTAMMPCWVIMRWKDPATYGSPESYYQGTWMATQSKMQNDPEHPHDSFKGFYITGDYPARGRYEVLQPLISKEYIDGKLVVTHFPMTHFLVDTIIPMFIAAQFLSAAEKRTIQQEVRRREEALQTEKVAQVLEENLPTWWGPVSYGAQGCRTSVLDRKMQQIQKVWDRLSRRGRPTFGRGMQLGSRPKPVRL